MSDQKRYKRQVAVHTSLSDIQEGSYTKEGGWEPSYVVLASGSHASRVNVFGVIIAKDDEGKSLMLDDTSARMRVAWFEDNPRFSSLHVGDAVVVIGRPREFQNEKYIVPEIIRSITNHGWLTVRKAELGSRMQHAKGPAAGAKNDNEALAIVEDVVSDTPTAPNTYDALIDYIRTHDTGSGVETAHIITQSGIPRSESLILALLKEGEIFEVRPGRVRVLE